MITASKKKKFVKNIQEYTETYLGKKNLELDESSTRLMINYLLSKILGYIELVDIKTEFRISEKYADYVIQIKRKKHFIIEVKAISLDLSDKHFRQALEYAANEGVEYIILTNGRQLNVYRVLFRKPILSKKILSVDFIKQNPEEVAESLIYISKENVLDGELKNYWKKFEVLEPEKLCKILYKKKIISLITKELKQQNDIKFTNLDILDSIHSIIKNHIDSIKPNEPTE